MSKEQSIYRKYLGSDISAGLVVFLIALPLCLGISMQSNAPLFSGIIAGIIGGIVVGFTSNSSINVSGPAASVALVFATAIGTLGSFEAVLTAGVLAGGMQILLGFLKAGTVAYFFPNAMIKGILASIGLVLIIDQIPRAMGIGHVFNGFKPFWQNGGEHAAKYAEQLAQYLNYGSVIITLVSMAIILLWDRPAVKKRFPFLKFFPSALAAVLVSIGLNELFKASLPDFALSAVHLVKLPAAGDVKEFFSFFTTPDFSVLNNMETYSVALSIAFIASLESLLSTEAGDKLDPYKRRTSTNRELKAQGLGNIASSLVGGLPVTAVIVRTTANVSSGGRTKTATITHGILMLICVALIPSLLNMIPLASLAAVLFIVGYKLTSIKVFKSVFAQGSKQFIPFLACILTVMFTDLITGIVVGGTIAVFFILRDNYKNAYLHDKVTKENPDKTTIKLSQEATFLNKADIMLFLNNIPENHYLIIDGSDSKFIHPDIFDIIEEFKETAKFKNIRLELIDLEDRAKTKRFWKK